MNEKENFVCPKCGETISKDDTFCRKCGASLATFYEAPMKVPQSEAAPEEIYERKLSLTQRFYKLVIAPSEAMKDIALAPEYGGVLAIIFAELVISSIAIALVFQKIQIVGPYAATIGSMLSAIIAGAILLSVGLLVIKWLIKSLLVRELCSSGSSWSFRTAASVTGYAYIVETIVGILGICVMWFLVPSFTLDTSNLEAAKAALSNYQAQISWFRFIYTIPVSFGGLLWKSYLGGLGAHFGTKEKCSVGHGVVVFFILGLISILISFFIKV